MNPWRVRKLAFDVQSILLANVTGHLAYTSTAAVGSRGTEFSPLSYGAVGNGSTNDRAAIESAATAAAAVNGSVIFPSGYTFAIDQFVTINNGVRGLLGRGGVIKCLASGLQSGILLRGIESGAASNVNNILVEGLKIDANNTTTGCILIYAQNASNVRVAGNYLYNMIDSVPILLRQFATRGAASGNVIEYNTCIGDTGTGTTGNGISVDSTFSTSPHASMIEYWKANFAVPDPSAPTTDTLIRYNKVVGGIYGLALSNIQRGAIYGNYLSGNIRNISAQNKVSGFTIRHNVFENSKSSSVHFAYMSNTNDVEDNLVITNRADGEGLLQAYVGCYKIGFRRNIVQTSSSAAPQYLVYLGADVSGCQVKGNHVYGTAGKAMIALEAAWKVSGAHTSHRTYGGDAGLTDLYANGSSPTNTIYGNNIVALANKPAVYISQIVDALGNHNPTLLEINSNRFGTTPSAFVHLIEQTSGQLSGITMNNNTFPAGAGSGNFVLPRGSSHFTSTDAPI